jgi:hypothetical protein
MTVVTLSEGLDQLAAVFAPYERERKMLEPQDAEIIRRCIEMLQAAALCLEDEVRRRDQAALGERLGRSLAMLEIVAEARRPGSNLALFGPACRPFTDGGTAR